MLAEVERVAARANPFYSYNHPELSRELRPKRLRVHASRDTLKCSSAGTGREDEAGMCDDLIQTLNDADVPEHLRPF